MDLYLVMHAVPGFLLLVSVTAHSHSHSILSIAPAQTFVQPCWESDRGIDPAKNNLFFFFFLYSPSQFSGRAVLAVAGWWKAGGQQDQEVGLGEQHALLVPQHLVMLA